MNAPSSAPGSSDPLRILICLLYYLPHRTGYSIYVQRIAEALAARGHQVTVLCARHARSLPAEEQLDGVRVVRCWAPLSLSRGMIMPGYPFVLDRLLADSDVVLANTPMAEAAVVAWMAGRRARPVLVTHHGDLVLPSGRGNRVISRVMLGQFRYLARRAFRLLICNEDYARQSHYLADFQDKVAHIRPPVRIPRPDPARARKLRAEWAPEGAGIIGFSGRFVAEKRPDLLLRALELLERDGTAARLVFAGQFDIPYEGTWKAHRALVERNRSRLVFLGSLADPRQMADFYAALDVLCLPSDTDSFALVQAEAMLCGTPVVATDTPGARMPVIETGMGRIVPRGDPAALAAALRDVLEHRDKYRKEPSAIERCFSLDETIDGYERHFREALARGAGRPPGA